MALYLDSATTELCFQHVDALIKLARNTHHRIPVVISGDSAWRHQVASSLQLKFFPQEVAWVSENTPKNEINNKTQSKAENVIGSEYQTIFYDIENHFSPNLFSALSGTLRGGGLFFILCPPLDQWKKALYETDKYLWRICELLLENNLYVLSKASRKNYSLIEELPQSAVSRTKDCHVQQEEAVNHIIHTTSGHRNRPLVLLANRGRGKSASLGLASAKLISSGIKEIIITAPSIQACEVAFKHYQLSVDPEFKNDNYFKYIPPDELIRNKPPAPLLIIDEAAGIPTPMLQNLLKHYSRIVFATTLHGYEGTGQCFPIKFFKILDQETPNWKKLALHSPIRWNDNDPLEKLTNKLFLFSPDNYTEPKPIDLKTLKISKISTQELICNESLLNNFYDLLSTAHYRTQPSDLQQIINNENIEIYLVISNSVLIATAITMREGELDENLSTEIYYGNRRPKGHITPQTLITHLGIKNAGEFRYLRLMRIAVRTDLQSQNIGSTLCKHIEADAKKREFDALSCSYGASAELLNFWKKQEFSLVRLGHHKKAKTNAFAAFMLKPLQNRFEFINAEAKASFHRNFPLLLPEKLTGLETKLTLTIFKWYLSSEKKPLADVDYNKIFLVANHNHSYEDNIYSIYEFSLNALCNETIHDLLSQKELTLLLYKTIYGDSWKEISNRLQFTGQREALAFYRDCLNKLLNWEKQNRTNL